MFVLAIQHFPLTLRGRRMLAPSIAHLTFERSDGQPVVFAPGQFIQVHFSYADGTATKRSYSLATIADAGATPGALVEIAVSYVPGGAATALFEGLAPGDTVDASGPFGRFCLMPNDSNRRYLLIATGTGVTPYRSMLPLLGQQMALRGIEVVLLFGARNPDELLYGDEFRAFANAHPGFRFVPCFSRELPAPGSLHDHADVRHGYVQQFIDEFAPDPIGDTAYLCGNPNMVDACFEALKTRGLAVAQIRREKYVSSK
ncbi:ferredoxin--NADP reductase [Luteimonas yindakuii]|uniref:Ferredoxin--NADP reductase n=1 Tax=Luteimonas yindakuii TaxID=2565782 RepID=A0A4Z1R6Y5_9GAMM|nr:FAD-binding oxidoreductase [Luteimonas yindakuii]TKS55402.1 ferredoxin--NADP reductase [Luteimonas yindakuii]